MIGQDVEWPGDIFGVAFFWVSVVQMVFSRCAGTRNMSCLCLLQPILVLDQRKRVLMLL